MTIKKQMKLARVLAGLSVSERENVLAVTKELSGSVRITPPTRRMSKPRRKKPEAESRPIREAMKAPAEKPARSKAARKPRRSAPERASASEPDFDETPATH